MLLFDNIRLIEEMANPMRYGFLDSINNVFYEVDTKEEYEQCLEFYKKLLAEEEEKKNYDAINRLDDFADVLGEFVY
jgi:hypothetical protein